MTWALGTILNLEAWASAPLIALALVACSDSQAPDNGGAAATVGADGASDGGGGSTANSTSVSSEGATTTATGAPQGTVAGSDGSSTNTNTNASTITTTTTTTTGSQGGASTGSTVSTGGAAAGGSGGLEDQTAMGGSSADGGSGGTSADYPIVDLLNGTDLSGWVIATGWPNGVSRAPLGGAEAEALFPIDEDGTLHVYRDAEDGSEQPRATLMTEASYANYKLWVEYRWGTKKFAPYEENPRDAGILFHISGDLGRIWPSSIEFQILEGQTGDLWVLRAKCTSLALNGGDTFVDEADGGTAKAFDGTVGGYSQHQRSAPYDSLSDWNELELTVTGDSAVYVVNGQLVNKVFDIQDAGGNTVTEGPIALQAEYSEVLYRNVRLQELPP